MTVTNERTKILTPASVEEASEILREANANNTPVAFGGGDTKQAYGNLLAPVNLKISTKKLNDLIAYQPEDLTITVGAGMEFERLQEILGQHNQWLPLDPPQLANATVGGILATNVSGPKRLLYGTARDLLIGCQFVLADGRIGRSGGRVVKNVTGYDLHKLLIGSLGTLGLLTEVTFKVLPKPQYSQWGWSIFKDINNAFQVGRQTARSNTSPAALEVKVNSERGADFKPVIHTHHLLFAAEGLEVAVRDQIKAMADFCIAKQGTFVEIEESEALNFWNDLRNMAIQPANNLQLKWSSNLTDLPTAYRSAENLARKLGSDVSIQARAGTGIVYLYTNLKENRLAQAAELIKEARQQMQRLGGSLTMERAPFALKEKLDVFGSVGDAFEPMKALKDKLDPKHLLNPGRFLKGL